MELLAISGSLQARSSNAALLEVARLEAPEGVRVVTFEGIAEIPAFNPDSEPGPASVQALRSAVEAADGLLFATPEYAFGMPGALKNALDWLVGTGELYGKRAVILSAAPSAERGFHARTDLERTLRAQGADVVASVTIAVPTAVRGNESGDAGIREAVAKALAAFDDA